MFRSSILILNLIACAPLLLGAQAGWMLCVHSCGAVNLGMEVEGLEDAHCVGGHCSDGLEAMVEEPHEALGHVHAESICREDESCADCPDADTCSDVFVRVDTTDRRTAADVQPDLAPRSAVLEIVVTEVAVPAMQREDPAALDRLLRLRSVVLLI